MLGGHLGEKGACPGLLVEGQGAPISKPQQVDQSESVAVRGVDVSSCSPVIGPRNASEFALKPGRTSSHARSVVTDDNDPSILELEASNGLEVSPSREIVVEDVSPHYRILNSVTHVTAAGNTIRATSSAPSKPETSHETRSIENGRTLQETIRPKSTRGPQVIATYQGGGGENFKTPPSCGDDIPLTTLGKASSSMGPLSAELETSPQSAASRLVDLTAAKTGDTTDPFDSRKQARGLKGGERQCTSENVESYASRKRDDVGVDARSKEELVEVVAVPGSNVSVDESVGTIGMAGERAETRGSPMRDKASKKAAADYEALPGVSQRLPNQRRTVDRARLRCRFESGKTSAVHVVSSNYSSI